MPQHEPEVLRARALCRTVASDAHIGVYRALTDEEILKALRDCIIPPHPLTHRKDMI